MDFFKILAPIEWVVAWVMYLFHQLFEFAGLDPASGLAWTLSIIGLVIVIRILLIPLFFKQIRAQRGLQLLQPEMQAIQKKYKGRKDQASKEAMSREMMALYKKHGTNPLSSCLPILLQSPIFFALFRVLNALQPIADGKRSAIGPINQEVAGQATDASIFGAHLSDVFLRTDNTSGKIFAVVLIVLMSATTFFTQRQLTMKNMPKASLEGPMAKQQKIMLYALPLIFAVSGINFPIGVLLYWTTTNLWTMGQQYYTIKRMPAPGSQAEKLLKEKQERKRAARGELSQTPESTIIEVEPRGQRVQPKRQPRQKRSGGGKSK